MINKYRNTIKDPSPYLLSFALVIKTVHGCKEMMQFPTFSPCSWNGESFVKYKLNTLSLFVVLLLLETIATSIIVPILDPWHRIGSNKLLFKVFSFHMKYMWGNGVIIFADCWWSKKKIQKTFITHLWLRI